MITDLSDRAKGLVCYLIQPNPPMSWRALGLVFAIISLVVMAIGMFLFARGLTLVLPFAGIDVVLLAYVFYITAKNARLREVVKIQPSRVIVERGHWRLETITEFERAWFKLDLIKSVNDWYPSQLMLRSRGKQLEIGKFLIEEERQGLARLLNSDLAV